MKPPPASPSLAALALGARRRRRADGVARARRSSDPDGDASSGLATTPPNRRSPGRVHRAQLRARRRSRPCSSAGDATACGSASSTPAPGTHGPLQGSSRRPGGRCTVRARAVAVSARRLAERPLLRAGHHAGPRRLVRAVRPAPAAPRRASRPRRPADEHVAGLQLRGQRLVVLRPERPRPSTSRGRSSTAACRRTTTATTAASSAGSRSTTSSPTSSPTTTSTGSHRRRRSRAHYDLIVFSGHEEYVTAHEYDLIERLPRPRRQPRVPLGERLLLQGRQAAAT